MYEIRMEKYCDFAPKQRNGAGIYLMIFPNGMRYIGKSIHIKDRLKQHIYAFYKKKEGDWHGRAVETFAAGAETKDDIWKCFWRAVDFYIMPTEKGMEGEYETAALKQIMENGKMEEFYNTSYPKDKKEDLFYGLL